MPDVAPDLDTLPRAAVAAGTSLRSVAAENASAPEFTAHFSPPLTKLNYVDAIYQMVLRRAADVGGEATFTNVLANRGNRTDPLFDLAVSPEHQARICSHTDCGILGA